MESSVELLLSDLHHRISGVSSSVRALVPATMRTFSTALVFRKPMPGYPIVTLYEAWKILRMPIHNRPFRIWHVRRNNEMFWAIVARDLLHLNVRIVFTSAAIRRHSWYPRQLIKKMDAVIACSTKAASFVPHVYRVVPHGVDLERFAHSLGTLPELAPFAEGGRVVGIVGRVRPEKGTDLFVRSMLECMRQYDDVCAVIVGKATAKYQPFKTQLINLISAAGFSDRFLWLDEVALENMPTVYHALDIVCAPALYEGFGLVPIEAMVSGTAVVASKTGAYEDMVVEGKNGLLVDCGDQNQLQNALISILDAGTDLASFKVEGQKIVREKFSLQSEFEGISMVYEQLWAEN